MAGMAQAQQLSRDQVYDFHRQGYLGPFTALSPTEMTAVSRRIDDDVFTTTGPNPKNTRQARHLDHRLVYDLATHSAVVPRLRGLLGNDIVLWTTFFFEKKPGGAEIPWHQDANFWPIEPPLTVSIWLAIDEVTAENSCVQIISESHRKVLPHVPARAGMAFGQEALPELVNTTKAIDMELRPGEFFIFNERLLHHSHGNSSERRRLGFSARYTVPFVNILDQDSPPLFPGHQCVLISGEDPMGFNRMTQPPAQ